MIFFTKCLSSSALIQKCIFLLSSICLLSTLLPMVKCFEIRDVMLAEKPLSFPIGPASCVNATAEANFRINKFNVDSQWHCFTKVITRPCSVDGEIFQDCSIELTGCLSIKDIREYAFMASRKDKSSKLIVKLNEW